jgi:ABC-2 type transport system permease protein
MQTLDITFALWLAGLKGQMQYRMNFVLNVLMGLVYQCTGFAFIWVVLSRFEAVAGWSLGEVAFLYGLRLVMHALNGFFSGQVFDIEWMVRQGDFDRYLVRPIAPLLQITAFYVPVSAFGDLIGGIGLFIAATTLVALNWSPVLVVYLLLAIVGGSMIEMALRYMFAALAFRFLSANAFLVLLDTLFSNFGNYPLTIFNSVLQFILTFALPLAFMAYLPAIVILERTSELQIHPLFAYGAPIAGVIWLVGALAFFQNEMRHYQSSGH